VDFISSFKPLPLLPASFDLLALFSPPSLGEHARATYIAQHHILVMIEIKGNRSFCKLKNLPCSGSSAARRARTDGGGSSTLWRWAELSSTTAVVGARLSGGEMSTTCGVVGGGPAD
jgi:hypothetical protein